MEKKQYELCVEIFKRLHKTGVLDGLIVIGSWCVYFYKDYFKDIPYIDQATIKTRDIDFLVENPAKIKNKVDIPELIRDLGFVTTFHGTEGYIKLDHPDLILEFLVPEKSRGADRPYPLPKLGVNATALRFLDFLAANTIKVRLKGLQITLPHPANFALHKLIISQRRVKEDKALKDRKTAIDVLMALVNKGETKSIKHIFNSIPKKWQNKIIKGLQEAENKEIPPILS